ILAKLLAAEIESPAQSQVISTIGIIPVALALWFIKDLPTNGNRLRGMLIAFGSGLVSCLGNIAFFAVFRQGAKAAAVIPVTDFYPAVTVVLAIVLLGERLNRWQAMGIALSLAAIYLFRVPGDTSFLSRWLLLALIPILLWGICGWMQKLSTSDVSGQASA